MIGREICWCNKYKEECTLEYKYNDCNDICGRYRWYFKYKKVLYKKLKWSWYEPLSYKFELKQDFSYDAGLKGVSFKHKYFELKQSVLTIKNGYQWNGANCSINTETNFIGALVHDVLYQAIEFKLLPRSYRKFADDLFISICKKEGMSVFRRAYFYKAVRIFGGFFV